MNQLKRNQIRFAYSWIGLLLLLYIVLRIIPISLSFTMSFFKWDLINPKKQFIGFSNYHKLMNDKNFILALK